MLCPTSMCNHALANLAPGRSRGVDLAEECRTGSDLRVTRRTPACLSAWQCRRISQQHEVYLNKKNTERTAPGILRGRCGSGAWPRESAGSWGFGVPVLEGPRHTASPSNSSPSLTARAQVPRHRAHGPDGGAEHAASVQGLQRRHGTALLRRWPSRSACAECSRPPAPEQRLQLGQRLAGPRLDLEVGQAVGAVGPY